MADIRYNFQATGVDSVNTAFRSIEKSAKNAAFQARELAKAQKEQDRARGGAGSNMRQRQHQDLSKLALKVAADQEKAAKQAQKAQEKAAQAVQRANERAAAASAKAAIAAQRANERAAQQSQKAQDKAIKARQDANVKAASAAAKQIAAATKAQAEAAAKAQIAAQKAADRAAAQAAKKAERAAEKVARTRERAAEKAAKAEIREAKKVALQQERAIAQERHRRQSENAAFVSRVGRGIVGFGKAAAVGGVALAGLAVRDNMSLNETSTRLAISARDSGGKMLDPRMLAKEFQDVATTTPGINANDAAQAAAQFTSLTGDLDTARKSLKTFATIATATGSDIGSIAETAASLSNQLGIKTDDQFKEVFASLIAQGKGGAFELKDMASQFQRLAASGGAFGISRDVQGVKTLGGFAQIARSGTGSPEQAATAIEAVMNNLKAKSEDLKSKYKVDVYNKDGSTRNLIDVITDSVTKIGGSDMEKKSAGIGSVFEAYGGRALNPLVTEFKSVYQSTSGTTQERMQAASDAVRKKFEDAANAAGKWSDVTYEASVAQNLASAQLTASWERFSALAGDKLTPAIVDVISRFVEIGETTNVFERIGDAMGALADIIDSIVKQLVSMGLLETKDKGSKSIENAERNRDEAAATLRRKGDKATPDDFKAAADAEKAVSDAVATDRARAMFMNEYDAASGGPKRKDADWLDSALWLERQGMGALLGDSDTFGTSGAGFVDDVFSNKDSNEAFARSSGESQAQFEIRQKWRKRIAGQGADGGGDGMAAVDAQMKALGAAADNATKSLNKIAMASQGSIVPQP